MDDVHATAEDVEQAVSELSASMRRQARTEPDNDGAPCLGGSCFLTGRSRRKGYPHYSVHIFVDNVNKSVHNNENKLSFC